ncbi:MAG: hypothetical protein ACRDTD_18130, partial [Pseudonocardiaceae bacterium]
MAAEGDVPARRMAASGKSVHSQEVHGKSVGIDDFDSAVPDGALHAAALEPVSAWQPWFLRTDLEGRTGAGT